MSRKKPLARVLDLVIAQADRITLLLLAIGIFGLILLPNLEKKAKCDEKSLMVGAASSTLRSVLADSAQEVFQLMPQFERQFRSTSFSHDLQLHLHSLGLETYVSSFAPCSKEANCSNLHGILRASHGDGKEAILVVTPVHLSSTNAAGEQQSAAAASMLLGAGSMLVEHLKHVKWLAKDVIWVIPDASCGSLRSLQHWVRTYQALAPEDWLQPFGRAGVMQQAIVVEAASVPINKAEVLVVGFDGQLPKLDSFVLQTTYSRLLQGVQLVMHGGLALPVFWSRLNLGEDVQQYLQKLYNMWYFMWYQARGLPTGPHAAFKEFLVDSVTLHLMKQGDAPTPPTDSRLTALHLAESLELSIRSLNNLVERYHHSYFLYVQTGLQHFVTVEVYIIPVVALIACLVLQAAAGRTRLSSMMQQRTGSAHVAEMQPHAVLQSWFSSTQLVLCICLSAAAFGAAVRRLWCPGCTSAASCSASDHCMPGTDTGGRDMHHHTWAMSKFNAASHTMLGWQPGIGVMCCMLAALLGGWGLLVGKGTNRKSVAGQNSNSNTAYRAADAGRRGVVASSLAAMALAGLACVNWALAYFTALPIACIAVATRDVIHGPALVNDGQQQLQQQQQQQQQQQKQLQQPQQPEQHRNAIQCQIKGRFGTRAHTWRQLRAGAVLAALSPIMMLLLLTASSWSGGTPSSFPSWSSLIWLLCCSRTTTYMVVCAVYLPYWLMMVLCCCQCNRMLQTLQQSPAC